MNSDIAMSLSLRRSLSSAASHLRRARLAGAALVLAGMLGPAVAGELLYVYDAGCPYCRAFEAEVRPAYSKTPEGRRAPLREIDLRGKALEAFALRRPVRYTPTFVLVEGGVELGRIEGYPGDEFFWSRLAQLLEAAPQ
jgi:hypothetical protein